MTRWIVLDVDDTLVRTFEVGLLKCRRVAEELGLEPPSEGDLKRFMEKQARENHGIIGAKDIAGISEYVRGPEGALRTVRGTVATAGSGSISAGSGFTITRHSTGKCPA